MATGLYTQDNAGYDKWFSEGNKGSFADFTKATTPSGLAVNEFSGMGLEANPAVMGIGTNTTAFDATVLPGAQTPTGMAYTGQAPVQSGLASNVMGPDGAMVATQAPTTDPGMSTKDAWGTGLAAGQLALGLASYKDNRETNKLNRSAMRQDMATAKTESDALAAYRASYGA